MGSSSSTEFKANMYKDEWKVRGASTNPYLGKHNVTVENHSHKNEFLHIRRKTSSVQKLALIERRDISKIPRNIEEEFYSNVVKWKADIEIASSMHDVVLNKAYQRIIGLGPTVIPLILKDLKNYGGLWFWALSALTGENPVKQVDAGRIRKMRETWLAWGAKKGYL